MMAGRMIRGGISFGEAYIDEEESVFVGKPIVEVTNSTRASNGPA